MLHLHLKLLKTSITTPFYSNYKYKYFLCVLTDKLCVQRLFTDT